MARLSLVVLALCAVVAAHKPQQPHLKGGKPQGSLLNGRPLGVGIPEGRWPQGLLQRGQPQGRPQRGQPLASGRPLGVGIPEGRWPQGLLLRGQPQGRPRRHANGTPAQKPVGIKAWLKAKEAELKGWAAKEAGQLKSQWKTKVVPHIAALKEKLGAEWQKDAPKIVALLKAKTGAVFEKAVNFLNKKLQA
ncbi:basic salivary proline-rich protein 4-like [Thrips palmi]|uniref:Basic salivary proline-rich protein 4-like n=1 Tax=Thrips palmi TaxID=161013 RepID=A0A6P8YE45_THRPL|nr:basic salivary proline-rich protein 4-like [Thrips palmi]XP_034234661.1 basic salivary proline-rich protein 4-like [Thrips palmi]